MRKHTPNDDPRWEDLFKGGSLRRVTRWGEPVLHAQTRSVTEFDEDLTTQVGVDLSLFVYICPDADSIVHHGAFCNPVVTLPEGRDRRLEAADEGCLSWPGGFQSLARPDLATCTGQDPWGNDITVTGTGFFDRCLQHETDHCNGVVFGDRLSKRSRRKLDEQHDKVAHLYPDDWPLTPKG